MISMYIVALRILYSKAGFMWHYFEIDIYGTASLINIREDVNNQIAVYTISKKASEQIFPSPNPVSNRESQKTYPLLSTNKTFYF